jgi:tRNA pseudouridine38-40 synthase
MQDTTQDPEKTYERTPGRRLALLVEYDGTRYAGWQRQTNAVSVQEVLEQAVQAAVGEHCNVIGAGRTDAGVHGSGQVAHCLVPEGFAIPQNKIAVALNTRLPRDIRIAAAVLTDKPFHARYDASAREYSYAISLSHSVFYRHYTWQPRFALNVGLLHKAAEVFLGSHNFTTFSKLNNDTKSYNCTIEISSWRRVAREHLVYTVRGDRFVYGMVRSLVGTMVEVAQGKRTVEEIREALDRTDRSLNSPLAPARGLVLRRIYYPDNPFRAHPVFKFFYEEERDHEVFFPH